MDIKIKPNTGVGAMPQIGHEASATIDGSGDVTSTAETVTDPVTQIAVELVEGRIDTTQAVDALIEQTMSMEMVARAPEALRLEVEAVLRDAIENDPYLAGLAHQLD